MERTARSQGRTRPIKLHVLRDNVHDGQFIFNLLDSVTHTFICDQFFLPVFRFRKMEVPLWY